MGRCSSFAILGLFITVPAGAYGLSVPPAARALIAHQTLVENLASASYFERRDALRKLAELGPEALPLLRSHAGHPDPEVRRRLEFLTASIVRKATLAPRRITLHADKARLGTILAELSEKAGVQLSESTGYTSKSNPADVYSFHFTDQPFWKVLDGICDAAGLVLRATGPSDRLPVHGGRVVVNLAAENAFVPFRSYDGPFRVVAIGFSYSRSSYLFESTRVAAGARNSHESLQLGLILHSEPRLPMLSVGWPRLDEAEDERGTSMMPAFDTSYRSRALLSRRYRSGGQAFSHALQLGVAWPNKKSRTVSNIRGRIPVTVLAAQKPIVLTDQILDAKGKKLQHEGTVFHIVDSGVKPGGQVEIKIGLGEGFRNQALLQTIRQRLEIHDKNGVRLPADTPNIQWDNQNNNYVIFMRLPRTGAGAPAAARLVFHEWSTLDHEVTFAFRDLPLP